MHAHRRFPLWTAVAIAVGIGAVAFALRSQRIESDRTARIATLEAENRQLRAAAQAAPTEAEAPLAPAAESKPAAGERVQKSPVDAVEQAKLLIQTRDRLSAANAALAGLQDRIRELEGALQTAKDESGRLVSTEASLRTRLAGIERIAAARETELKGKEDRLAQLESANVRLREENRANADRLAQTPKLLGDLAELDRRRETCLNNVLRRYKDVTDQYRALSTHGENPAGLGRIQDGISLAEEDLRQIANLNAQARRLQQKIAK